MNFNRNPYVFYLFFGVLCAIPLFYHLDRLSIRQWDESRLAVSALEMTQSGNLLVTTFEQTPDMWNTKPPLMIWLQATCMKILGYNEWAVRLPSAIAGLATLAFLFIFFHRSLARSDIAAFTILSLVSCAGYITVHVTRTGDYDALLTLFTTSTVFLTFLWLESKNDKLLFWITISVMGMGLTKGIQGFMIFPGLALYILLKGNFFSLIKNKKFWFSAFAGIAVISGYYVGRELLNTGYLSTIWETELAGRFKRENDFHAQPFFYYIKELSINYFPFWKYFLPLGLLLGLTSKHNKIRNLTQLLLISSVSYLVLISLSKTKLWWYQTPLLPLFASLIGIGISECIARLGHQFAFNKKKIRLTTICLFVLLAIYPYGNKIAEIHNPLEEERMNWKQHKMGACWQQLPTPDQVNIVFTTYNAQAIFYAKAAGIKNKQIQYFDNIEEVPTHQMALVCYDKDRQKLRDIYEVKFIESCESCDLVQVMNNIR